MIFSKIDTQSGLSFLYKLVDNNKEGSFELTFKEGDVVLVKFDIAFEDDSSSTDATDLDETNEYHTLSFTIEKVIKDVSKHYKKGNVILISPYTMPKEYKLK